MRTALLGHWLRESGTASLEPERVCHTHTGLSKGAISAIINRGHVPQPETLCVIADYFNEPREKIYLLADVLSSSTISAAEEMTAPYLFRQLAPLEQQHILQCLSAWPEVDNR